MQQKTIAHQMRLGSMLKTDKRSRQQMILGVLNRPMTAREIAHQLGYYDLNAVKPRITELVQAGTLFEAGSKHDIYTDRNVTIYAKAPAPLER
ncbi:MAG TPA: DNA gyrase [Clostridia bacterium]|nr:DNA gyrase [Clostridia bacterium]